jgi:uncharacterized protein (DUF58 family)
VSSIGSAVARSRGPSVSPPSNRATEKPRNPWEFNGVVRLTKVGTTYILGTIVLAIAALNTGNNAIYIGVAFMLGGLLLSGIASKGGLKHLHVEVGAIDEAWAGKPADGTLRVRNASRVWNVRDVVFVSADLATPVVLPLLPRRKEIVIPVQFLFQRRGIAQLTQLDSYTRYPFGFFLKKRRLRVQSEVVVYPRIQPESAVQERFRTISGGETSEPRPGEGTEIHSFREYAHGDSLRHVHWKKSAALGRWIMKQNEAEGAHAIHVAVDPYKPRNVSDDDFEEMISDAATFIFDATTRGFDVTLSLPRVDVRSREGQFRALALVNAIHEPVELIVDRNAIYFSVGGRHDAKSA